MKLKLLNPKDLGFKHLNFKHVELSNCCKFVRRLDVTFNLEEIKNDLRRNYIVMLHI